MVTRLKLKGID
ncbi:hypothetical protein Pint_30239 [Pistacia integerrima]|nr:hypothetical protein Pint_30239 [Pistacia integerrima]